MAVVDLLKEIEVKAQEGQVGIAAELQAKYDEGFKDGKVVGFKEGQDSIVLPDPSGTDKIYTQGDMDKLAEVVRGEKDAEYAPKLQEKDDLLAAKDVELAAVKLELETLKADFDAKVVNGAMARVDAIKAYSKQKLTEFAKADDTLAESVGADIDAL